MEWREICGKTQVQRNPRIVKKFILVLLLSPLFSSAQIDTAEVRKLQKYEFGGVYKSSVSANFLGLGGAVGISYDYLLSPHWRLEVGTGWKGTGFGFDLFPWKVKRGQVRFRLNLRNNIYFSSDNLVVHSFAPGLTWFARFRWNFGIDVGAGYVHTTQSIAPYDFTPDDFLSAYILHPTFNVKVGYRFSFKMMKRRRELEKEKREKLK